MVEVVVSIASEIGKYLVDPVGRQLGYLIHYNSNLAELRELVKKLGEARRSLQLRVDEAERHGDGILPSVLGWMERAERIMEKAERIMQKAEEFIADEKNANKRCFNGLRPNLISRYQLSRQAKKKSEDVTISQGECNFRAISYRFPLPVVVCAPGKGYEDLASRIPILDEIMEALRHDDINMIGVWGMGGVGKTTLAQQVAKLARDDKLFDQVVMALVSQTVDLKKIQAQIANALDFKFNEESEFGRAGRLSQRLKIEKKLLIILDDIWAKLDLGAIGIPHGDDHKGCKVVLTSRKHGVLSKQMGTQKNFAVKQLLEDEAWSFFKKMAGDSIEKPDLQSTAVEVVRKCGGLPIAIVTVAKALKYEDLTTWKDALRQLTRSIETNIEGIEATIFLTLELSYNHLYGNEVKSLFLLCGLLDYGDTPVDSLFKYGVGRDLFENINTLEEARDRLHTLINNLKASSLLLESDDEAHVRMHDVVRGVARAIASKGPHPSVVKEDHRFEEWSKTEEPKRCTYISLNCQVVHKLPERLVCPELEFFLLRSNNSSLKIPNTFFEGMKELKVLDLSKMHFTTLPSSLCFLTNLRTLCMDECKLGDISLIGDLMKLEVLSLVGSNIKQLPREIAKLSCLRLLDLTYCHQLEVIPRNVLSSLSQLENLCMEHSSFTQWEDEEISNQESNACLSELKHLPYLTILDVKTRDLKLLPKDLAFENLISYRIYIGEVWDWYQECKAKRVLRLNKVHRSLHLEGRIGKLLQRTEELYLRELSGTKSVLYELDGDGFPQLKHLHISRSQEIKYIIDSKHQWIPQHGAFPLLESLILYDLVNLEEVCHGPIPVGCFGKLKTLGVVQCHGLKLLLLLSTAKGLSQLEKLNIKECNSTQQIITYGRESEIKEDDHDGTNLQLFPKLRSLKLDGLPQLINFSSELDTTSSTSRSTNAGSQGTSYQGNLDTPMPFFSHKVTLPYLEKLKLYDLLMVKEIWHPQLPLGSFYNLRTLRVEKCSHLLNFIPSSLIQSLQNLEVIDVRNCEALEHVFDLQGLDGNAGIFPKLKYLTLILLPRLRHIAWNENKNDNMRCLFSTLTLGELKQLIIRSCGIKDKGDVNTPGGDIVLFDGQVKFPSLEYLEILRLNGMTKIWHSSLYSSDSFGGLKEIRLFHCKKLQSLFPTCIVRALLQLEQLTIDSCEVEEIVAKEDGADATPMIELPKVTYLCLRNLTQLKSFYPEKHITKWPRLKTLIVDNCGDLKIMACQDTIQQPLFFLEKDTFPNMEELSLASNQTAVNMCGEQIQEEFIPKLRVLKIKAYHGISIVIPSNMLHILHNLEELIVKRCNMVEEIIGVQSLKGEEFHFEAFSRLRNLKLQDLPILPHLSGLCLLLQNLQTLDIKSCQMMREILTNEGGSEIEYEIVFTKLQDLELYDLPNLTSFCSASYSFTFPSLRSIKVRKCPKMKFFCEGSLSTPMLRKVNNESWEGDLNTTISKWDIEKFASPSEEDTLNPLKFCSLLSEGISDLD